MTRPRGLLTRTRARRMVAAIETVVAATDRRCE